MSRRLRSSSGQASVLMAGVLSLLLVVAVVLGAVARGVTQHGGAQSAADLSALAAGHAMHAAYPRLFVPARVGGRRNPALVTRSQYEALGRAAAERTARANGVSLVRVEFPDAASGAPLHVRVTVRDVFEAGEAERVDLDATAEAEIVPGAGGGDDGAAGMPATASGGGYDGPLAYRQGKPMRPDVAQAFDRLERAARADGHALLVTSGFRSDAEQAILWNRNPDPRWVARPGTSLHRLGTELDLGPPSAYGWLAANAEEFGFLRRYSWEPWHFGYVFNARSRPAAASRRGDRGDGETTRTVTGGGSMPSFVPERYAPAIARSAQRWNVSVVLLSAQLYAESTFNPNAVSRVGAMGLAQFMPATAAQYGLTNPFDPDASIDAQAHLMHDLLEQFGSVPLALAAYNAGPRPVKACMCVPPYAETQGYVTKILALMGGAGDVDALASSGLEVRLVR